MLRKALVLGLALLSSIHHVDACTGIVQRADDGDWIYARTMEFGADLVSFELLFVPRRIAYVAQSKTGSPLKWETKYAHVGFNPFGMPIVADGINEKGLGAGAFYFPGWAEYEQVDSKDINTQTISNLDFVSWVLGNFASVKEVNEALKTTKVVGVLFESWGIIPPLHYIIADASGDRAVIEYVDGKLHVYDAPIGTITNSPSYDWHSVNARNYIGLHALNSPSVKISGEELSQFGQGSGAIGLPGDFTPPSRFIRASFIKEVAESGKDAQDEVLKVFKILNQFDIPRGVVREKNKDGKETIEETQWTSAADLSGKRYYFHTATSRVIRTVDLKKLDLDAGKIRSIQVDTPETFVDLNSSFQTKS